MKKLLLLFFALLCLINGRNNLLPALTTCIS